MNCILTGFTSLAKLIDIFGTVDYPMLQELRDVIGFDPYKRVSQRLPINKFEWIPQLLHEFFQVMDRNT